MIEEVVYSQTLEMIYLLIGFIIFWSIVLSISIIGGIFIVIKVYKKWVDFWVEKSNKRWEDCNPSENEYPSMKEIRESWIFLQIAHPIKYGLLEDSEEHKKEWKQKIESKQEK